MKTKYVIDSYTWIEYFNGTEKGREARQYIESGAAITPTVAIAEISDKYVRTGKEYLQKDLGYILENSEIISLSPEIAAAAGYVKKEMRLAEKDFGLVDSIILATARFFGAKVVTGDPHFSKTEDAIMI